MTYETPAVIAGLAVGIALIVIFASYARPAFTMSDDEVRDKVRKLPEVKAFNERFTPTEQISHDGTTAFVKYQTGRSWNLGSDPTCNCDDLTKTLELTIRVNPYGKTSMILECLGPISGSWTPTVKDIQTTSCLEVADPYDANSAIDNGGPLYFGRELNLP